MRAFKNLLYLTTANIGCGKKRHILHEIISQSITFNAFMLSDDIGWQQQISLIFFCQKHMLQRQISYIPRAGDD